MFKSKDSAEIIANKILHSFYDASDLTAPDVIEIICLLFSKIIYAFMLEPTLNTAENRLQLLQYIETIVVQLEGKK